MEQGADIEHLIIDGASTDRSIEIARQLVRDHPDRVKLVSEPDRGIYDAMNKGIHLSGGRYLFFLNAGDTLFPGVLEKVACSLPSHDRGFVYGNVIREGRIYDGPFSWRKLCVHNICHQAIFYGREIFRICGDYNLRYRINADWDMNLRCFGRGEIKKMYIPITVSNFESPGASAAGDAVFMSEKDVLIRRHLGLRRAARVRLGLFAGRLLARGWSR